MKDSPLSDLLRQASINTENQFMAFSDYIWKYFPDTDRITLLKSMYGITNSGKLFDDELTE